MSFDIYGQYLRAGHCEVHPDMHEQYPCSICMMDNAKRIADKQLAREDGLAQEAAYYAQMFGDEEYESWGRANPQVQECAK